jgi:hypothetical protein
MAIRFGTEWAKTGSTGPDSMKALALSCLGLALGASAQQPPDPTFGVPGREWTLGGNPYFTGSDIGAMYLPSGRIRRVSWYEESGLGGLGNDPPGWEKRTVLVFNDAGQCVEVEEWAMGLLEFRTVLQAVGSSPGQRGISWILHEPVRCTMSEAVRDSGGHQITTLVTPWTPDGVGPSGGDPSTTAEYGYDAAGRVLWETIPNGYLPGTSSRREWWYDRAGRIRVRSSQLSERGQRHTDTFDYDEQGRIRARSFRSDGESTEYGWEFEWDLRGRMIEDCSTIDGRISSTTSYRYAEDGRLVSRSSFEFNRPLARPYERTLHTEESFNGIDRPLTREVWDQKDRRIETTQWTYQEDSHGNWTRKTPHQIGINREFGILRVIEYAD